MDSTKYRHGWIPEPDVEDRGTATIIYSCFFTIYACTWTALHLNVPRRSLSRLGRLLRKIQWMIVAVLAPEYITLTALVQRYSTVVALSNHWPLKDDSRVLAFYALMGGFELHFDDETYHRLKYSELRALVRAGFVDAPLITAEEVTDKSKGNWFTKSLALLQIGWFILQLLGRVAQRLATTPLELFTLGAVACTIISYINWWAKPLDVNTSTDVTMSFASEISKQALFVPLEKYRIEETSLVSKADFWLGGLREFVPASLGHKIGEHSLNGTLAPDLQLGNFDDRRLPTFLGCHLQPTARDVVELLGGIEQINPGEYAEWEIYRDGIWALRSIDRSISRIDVKRYGRRRDYYNMSGAKKSQPIPDGQRPEGLWSDAFFEDRNVYTSSSIGFGVTTLVFGACHLLAWNYGFPSTVEIILWRIMSIACTTIPLILLVVDMSPTWLGRSKRQTNRNLEKSNQSSTSVNRVGARKTSLLSRVARMLLLGGSSIASALTSYTSSISVLLVYMILRVYLVVAIFTSFRSVPAGVYKTVDWSLYIPHFG